MTFTRFTVDSSTPSLWRVTFDHPPINLIDYVMIGELGELLAEVERNEEPAVAAVPRLRTGNDPGGHAARTAANGSCSI